VINLADKTSLSQRVASDPQKSAWVSANAGSGKTHVLVNRIIRLMLGGAEPGKILALTFTKAAAAEMANRLNNHLAGWAMLSREELLAEIADITGAEASPAQVIRARCLFAHALETPGGLKIQTIHAFCERVLHRFALEANVAPNFEILDDRTGAELLNQAREIVFANSQDDHDLQLIEDLRTISGALSAADFDGLISQVLKRRSLMRGFHQVQGGMDKVISNLSKTFGLTPGETREDLLDVAIGTAGPVPATLDSLIELFSAGSSNDVKSAGKLNDIQALKIPERQFELYKSLFFIGSGAPRKNLITKKLGEENPDIKQFLETEQERIAALNEKLSSLRITENTGALLRIADKILSVYEASKNARALLDYDDLIEHTAELLMQTQAAAWVLYKLDNGIDHILVDEAQDTSPEQWQVISALSNEFFAGIGAGTTLRTLFAVGDEKQSIFGFQGANPEEFDRMRRHFQRRAGYVDREFEKVELTVSFRSTAQVLQAVDLVFAQEIAAQGMTSFGATPVHEAFRHGQAGLVEIWPIEKPDEEQPKDPWDAPLDYTSTSSPRVVLAHRIASAISDWIGREVLTPRGRNVRAGDILILVRRRNNFVDAMVEALKQKNVPVAGIDRMKLSQQLAIMDLLALARFVLLPEDDLNLAVVLKGPLFGLDDDDLFDLAYDRKSTLWRALKSSHFSKPYNSLAILLGKADRGAAFEFFSFILNTTGGRRKFIKRLGMEVNDPLDEFLSLCLDYEKTNTPSLQGFVAWFSAGDVDAKRDMDQARDEVRIMTVHGAKGLEANIVILPDTCHQIPDARKTPKILTTTHKEEGHEDQELLIWRPKKAFENETVKISLEREQEKEVQEYNRLLYVAMTRARDRLYIAGYEGKQSSSKRSWYNLISETLKPQAKEVLDAKGDVQCWRLETEQTVEPVEKTKADGEAIEAVTPPEWAQQPAKTEEKQVDLVSPSSLEPVVTQTEENQTSDGAILRPSPLQTPHEERYLRGQLIHSLLEYAPGANRADYAGFCQRFLEHKAPSLLSEERTRIVDEVQRVLGAEGFSVLFDEQGLSEVPIVGQVQMAGQGMVKVSGRIDRLIVRDNEVLAIDFKTDRNIAENPEDITMRYQRQMAVYKHLLSQIFPDRQITCYLLWTSAPLLMELPEALLSSAITFDNN